MSHKITAAPWLAKHLEALQLDPEFLAEDLVLDVCEQIHAAMKDEDVNAAGLADRLGLSRSAVSQLLSGDQNISLNRLVRVALALNRAVEPPRLVPLDPVEVEECEAPDYTYTLAIPLEYDRVAWGWSGLGVSAKRHATELHTTWHGGDAVPASVSEEPALELTT